MARIRWQSGVAISRDIPETAHPVFGTANFWTSRFVRPLLPSPASPGVAARQTALTPLAAFSNKVAQICHGTKTGTFRLRDRGRVAKRGRDGGGFLDFFLRFPRRLKSGFLRALYVFLPRVSPTSRRGFRFFVYRDVPENLRNARQKGRCSRDEIPKEVFPH